MLQEELIILEATKKSVVTNYCLVFHHSDFHALVHYRHEATYFFIKITRFNFLRHTSKTC